MRIVGTHADIPDTAALFQFLRVGQDRAIKHCPEVLFTVHIVNHAHIDVIGLKPCQQILKRAFCLFNIPGACILSVFKHGAQMPLDYKLVPPPLQCFPQIIPGGRLRHEDVDIVDPLLLRCIRNSAAFFGG